MCQVPPGLPARFIDSLGGLTELCMFVFLARICCNRITKGKRHMECGLAETYYKL